MIEVLHIVPENDLREHIVDPEIPCWCKPNIEDSIATVFHNSADGREAYEMGARQPH